MRLRTLGGICVHGNGKTISRVPEGETLKMVDQNSFNATGRLVGALEKKGNGFYATRIAIQDDYKDKEGKWVDSASFLDVTVSRNFQSEDNEKAFLARFPKGARVAITGSIRQRVSEGKDGKKYSNITVIISSIVNLEQKAKDEGEAAPADGSDDESAPF